MANTPSFNWETPDDTDLVKDGAAAIRTLGNAIDSSMTDLKGGTTGQVLSKASNTDMDFTWVAQDDSNAIQNALLTTTGDTIYASSASTPARLGIGSTGQVLTVSGGVPAWTTPSTGGTSWSLVNSGGTALTGAATITVSGITKNSIAIYVYDASSANANSDLYLRVNSDSTSKYGYGGLQMRQTTSYTGSGFGSTINGDGTNINANDKYLLVALSGNASASSSGFVEITGATGSGPKFLKSSFGNTPASTGTDAQARVLGGIYTGSSAITSISIVSSSGNFDNGTIYVYEG